MVQNISVKELAKKMESEKGAFLLLDCREPMEWEIGHIEGAKLIPMAQTPARLQEIDREKEVIVYCHHGNRSLRVGMFLEQQGYSQVKNLSGGIDAWSCEVDPTVPRY